ncbi:hypothetical protein QFZ27_001578 [Inquilinus ginsengisoli]|uniref:hypothetical protein n=1 Tax=Inquilinus ginsengisoli TaxID=363840 RepID=UPI003D233E6C
MTDWIEDAATPMPAALPWTPPAGPVALSQAKIGEIKALAQQAGRLVEASLFREHADRLRQGLARLERLVPWLRP